MTGKDLATDLADNLVINGSMVWCQKPLGSVMFSNPAVADVVAINRSYTTTIRIYEVKISRGDYLRDVNQGKYRRYFDGCHQLYFACPKGLIRKDEIPEGCGLITQSDHGWRVAKAAPRREVTVSIEFLISLLMKDPHERMKRRQLERAEYTGLRAASYKYGVQLAQDIADGRDAVDTSRALMEEAEATFGRKFHGIGSLSSWLRSEIAELTNRRRYAQEGLQLADITDQIMSGRYHAGQGRRIREIADRLDGKDRDGAGSQ